MNIRIPERPDLLIHLIDVFTQLRDESAQRGEPWPASLEEWADMLEARRETIG